MLILSNKTLQQDYCSINTHISMAVINSTYLASSIIDRKGAKSKVQNFWEAKHKSDRDQYTIRTRALMGTGTLIIIIVKGFVKKHVMHEGL